MNEMLYFFKEVEKDFIKIIIYPTYWKINNKIRISRWNETV